MKTYVEGQEIAPRVTISKVDERPNVIYPYELSTPSGSQWLTQDTTDYIASLGEQIESLKRQVPTEWRTGAPDVSGVNPESQIEYVDDDDLQIRCIRVRSASLEQSDWDDCVHRIIPYVAPPAPPTEPQEIKPSESFTLTLDREQAQFLMDVIGKIGGSPEKSRRRHADEIRNALGDFGFQFSCPSDFEKGREHLFMTNEPEPAPPQPKTLTVDDLPTREDLEWGSQIFREHHPESGSRVGINVYVACSDVGITFWANGTTEHAAVEAAIAAVNAGKLDQFLEGGAK